MASAPAAAQDFQGLGDIPGGSGQGRAVAISGDGGAVAGYAYIGGLYHAFRWTESGGMERIDEFPAGSVTIANGISADGRVIVGFGDSAPGVVQAFRWTESGGIEGLGFLLGGSYSEANDASGDGSVVVGRANAVGVDYAFRWTQAGMVSLGVLPGFNQSTATGVSDDGAVVVGAIQGGGGAGPSSTPIYHQAFRWTQAGGMVGLGYLGDNDSQAYGVSGDGKVVVGTSTDGRAPYHYQAFRWTEAGGMVGLGVPAGAFESDAYGANFTGSVIVGSASGHATVWTEVSGTRYVTDVLQTAGVSTTGWDLQSAEAVSNNGAIVTGIGFDPNGNRQPWIASLSLGLVTFADMYRSLGSLVGVGQSAQQNESAHLSGLIDLASTYGAQDAGAWNAWGGMSDAHYDVLKIDPEAREGDLGFAYQLTSAWRLGAGVRWGGRDDDLPAFNSTSESAYGGVSLFSSYEPSATGLRLYGALAANWTQNKIDRGYLNGSTQVFSHGDQDGFAYGAALRVGWAAALNDHISVTPFLAYEASRIALDAYTETSGPFPAHFDKTSGQLEIARAGAQLDIKTSERLRFWLSAAAAERLQDELPSVSGEVMALSVPFAIEGAEMNRDWWEGGAGAEWRASQRTRLQLGVQASSDGDTAAHYGARVSAIVSF